jgi:F-type H+-transporting ATPase subunit b
MHEQGFFANPRTWVAVAFVAFVVIFGRRVWGALAKLLDDRAAQIRAELDEAQRLRHEAEAMLKDAEARRAAAAEDALRQLAGARAEAQRVAAAAAADAAAATSRREQMAVDRIAAAEKAAVDDVRRAAAEVATAATQLLLTRDFDAAADAALLDTAIAGLPAALRAA